MRGMITEIMDIAVAVSGFLINAIGHSLWGAMYKDVKERQCGYTCIVIHCFPFCCKFNGWY